MAITHAGEHEDGPCEGMGAMVWCVWSVLVLVALAVSYVGHPRIAGAVLVATSVVLGLLFAPMRWWRL